MPPAQRLLPQAVKSFNRLYRSATVALLRTASSLCVFALPLQPRCGQPPQQALPKADVADVEMFLYGGSARMPNCPT